MRREDVAETLIGLLVVVTACAFFVFAAQRAGAVSAGPGVVVYGEFSNVDGVTPGTDVRLSGVKIGTVSDLQLLPDKANWVRVAMQVRADVKIPADSTARVLSGLLGGTHVAIESGGAAEALAAGESFQNTEGATDLLSLMSALTQGGGADQGASAANER